MSGPAELDVKEIEACRDAERVVIDLRTAANLGFCFRLDLEAADELQHQIARAVHQRVKREEKA